MYCTVYFGVDRVVSAKLCPLLLVASTTTSLWTTDEALVLAGKTPAHEHATNNPEPSRRFRFGGRSADDGTETSRVFQF
jgi:hypothetical protein